MSILKLIKTSDGAIYPEDGKYSTIWHHCTLGDRRVDETHYRHHVEPALILHGVHKFMYRWLSDAVIDKTPVNVPDSESGMRKSIEITYEELNYLDQSFNELRCLTDMLLRRRSVSDMLLRRRSVSDISPQISERLDQATKLISDLTELRENKYYS
jgi:hypothetical protein